MKRRHTEAKKKRQRGGRAYRAAVYAASVLALLTVLCTGAAIVWKSDALLQGLAVTPALQEPALPNGCEAASLASVLDYYGLQADMLDLAYGYIPRQDNVIFARLMDAGKLLFGKISSKEIIGSWVKIGIKVYLHE